MEQLLGNNKQHNENSNPKSQKYNKGSKGKKKPIKIKYISSPMMVRANNASEFRAIVQELTGQNSNFTDVSSDHDFSGHVDYDHHHDHDDQMITTSWTFPATTPHDHHDGYAKAHHVDDDYANSNPNSSGFGAPLMGSQFDEEANHFWRSEFVSDQSFNGGFQLSPCVFV